MGKKRVALLHGYNGGRFRGSQINGDEETVERAICDSVRDAGYISEPNAEDYAKVGLQRSSRTDKGVHAAFQVISLKIEVSAEKGIASLEKHLRPALCAKDIVLYGVLPVPRGFEAKLRCESRIYEYMIPVDALGAADGSSLQARKALLEEAFSLMAGTHDFHNFTVRNQEKGTSRFVRSISTDMLAMDGLEWIRATIHGQSFMTHQIRKMIGVAVLLASQTSSLERCKEVISLLFGPGKYNVPKAPGNFLLLVGGLFTNYNKRFGDSHGKIEMDERSSHFKEAVLYPSICTQEKVHAFREWECVVMRHREEFKYLMAQDEETDK
jgi:tRNA pseudouridine38-40 synthase